MFVDRSFTNNRYHVVNAELFIHQGKHNDKNGTEAPLNGQVEFELTQEEKEVIDATNFTRNQAKSLLQLCNNKVDKLISMIKYVSNKANISNKFGYIKALLERGINIEDTKGNYPKKSISFVDNCSSRNYTEEWYQNIENRLLYGL